MKSGNLKFLEPSGPLQACNGTDLQCRYSTVRSLNATANAELRNSPCEGHFKFADYRFFNILQLKFCLSRNQDNSKATVNY